MLLVDNGGLKLTKKLTVDLIQLKAMGKTNYKDYKAYLNTKTDDELIDIKVSLESRYSKWNKILTSFFMGLTLAVLGFLGKFMYDFVVHSLELYSSSEAFVMIKGALKLFLLIIMVLIIFLLIFYNSLANTKQKLLYLEEYQKERATRRK